MEYKVLEKPGFKIIGISIWTINKENIAATDIYNLWQQWLEENMMEQIPGRINDDIYNLYCDYEAGVKGRFQIILGCRVRSIDRIPIGMTGRKFPHSRYAVFNYQGKLPYAIVNTWNYIKGQADFKRSYLVDYDVYEPEAYDPVNARITTCVSIK